MRATPPRGLSRHCRTTARYNEDHLVAQVAHTTLTVLDRMTELKVLVVGDLMLDVYLWGHASRISPEAPVMVVEVERETSVPGGAANVVHNLAALGARVRVLGVIGDDAPGEQLRNALREQGADTEGLVVDAGRPTTVKSRVMSHHRQVMRIDRENKQPISPAAEAEICQQIEAFGPQHDVILISDYAKGLVTPRIARTATAQREQGCFVAVNAKPGQVHAFAGADLVTLNQIEAEQVAGTARLAMEPDVRKHGPELRSILDVRTLVITQGGRGMSAFSHNQDPLVVPAVPVEVYDVAGAGDTTISTLTMALRAGADLETASQLAMRAASIVVGKLGVATATLDELRDNYLRVQP